MDYQIALSPELGLTTADFIAAWNEDTEARNVAAARLSTPTSTNFDPALAMAVDLAIAVGTGVASGALYDLLKKVLVKKGVKKHTHIEEMKKPDGTRLFIVDIDEQ